MKNKDSLLGTYVYYSAHTDEITIYATKFTDMFIVLFSEEDNVNHVIDANLIYLGEL